MLNNTGRWQEPDLESSMCCPGSQLGALTVVGSWRRQGWWGCLFVCGSEQVEPLRAWVGSVHLGNLGSSEVRIVRTCKHCAHFIQSAS